MKVPIRSTLMVVVAILAFLYFGCAFEKTNTKNASPDAINTAETKAEKQPNEEKVAEAETAKQASEKVVEKTTFFNQHWLKTVVSIEQVLIKEGNEVAYRPMGTGFIVQSPQQHFLLVTAKHVVVDEEKKCDKGTNCIEKGLAFRLNLKQEKSKIITDEFCQKNGAGDWILSNNSDVALRFMYAYKNADLSYIPLNFMLKAEDLQAGTPALILGFPMGLRSEDYATPIARDAMVALVEKNNLIIDGFAFPGNSGGPIVYVPSMLSGGLFRINNYQKDQRLIGLMSSYIPYRDVAISQQTKRPRVIFEENSGLANVVPCDEILKLIEREDFIEMDKKLK